MKRIYPDIHSLLDIPRLQRINRFSLRLIVVVRNSYAVHSDCSIKLIYLNNSISNRLLNVTTTKNTTPKIVIIGAGFGGLFAAKGLRRTDAEITIIDQQNHHLFQPLLYQVATAGLSPSDIAWPIRNILKKNRNVKVLLDTVTGINTEDSEVLLGDKTLPFDYLIIATGARHTYFGNDDWEQHAPGLKSIDDATNIRRQILMAFEQAEMCTDENERKRHLTFAIVGAGPTGVELAGTIAELASRTLAEDFRQIDSRSARVLLLEGGTRVLPTFPEKLSRYAKHALNNLGVEVLLEHSVTDCNDRGVVVSGEEIPCATILWAAGVQASPAGRWLNSETDKAGRVLVSPDLSVKEHMNIFVIGDTALIKDNAGLPVPGTAPAAKQQGRYVAKLISNRLLDKADSKAFRYKDYGNLATIGRKSAVIDMPRFRMKGFLAWIIWVLVHIYFLIGVRAPLAVATKWAWQYLTFGRGARLITGKKKEHSE